MATKSTDPYRMLLESNPQPMWVHDLSTLAFLAVNEAAVAHDGYSHEEFLRITLKDIGPADDISRPPEKSGKASEGLERPTVWRQRKKDGAIVQVEIIPRKIPSRDGTPSWCWPGISLRSGRPKKAFENPSGGFAL